MTEPKPRSRRVVQLNNDPCPIDAATLERGVAAIERVADALEDVLPAARALEELNEAQDKLCAWLKKWGPWALGLAPFILSAAGAMTPETATKLIAAITAAGG